MLTAQRFHKGAGKTHGPTPNSLPCSITHAQDPAVWEIPRNSSLEVLAGDVKAAQCEHEKDEPGAILEWTGNVLYLVILAQVRCARGAPGPRVLVGQEVIDHLTQFTRLGEDAVKRQE